VQIAKAQIGIDPVSCSRYMTAIQNALEEITEISHYAAFQVEGGLQGTLTGDEKLVGFRTFDALFGSSNRDQRRASANQLLSRSFISKQ
jgi:hypothetical protein